MDRGGLIKWRGRVGLLTGRGEGGGLLIGRGRIVRMASGWGENGLEPVSAWEREARREEKSCNRKYENDEDVPELV